MGRSVMIGNQWFASIVEAETALDIGIGQLGKTCRRLKKQNKPLAIKGMDVLYDVDQPVQYTTVYTMRHKYGDPLLKNPITHWLGVHH